MTGKQTMPKRNGREFSTTGRPDIIMVSILLFAILGKISDMGLAVIGKRLLKWQDAYASSLE